MSEEDISHTFAFNDPKRTKYIAKKKKKKTNLVKILN